jgi:signal transduction histidine kinase
VVYTEEKPQPVGNSGPATDRIVKHAESPDDEIDGETLRGSMHYYAMIPFVAVLVSAAFGAVSIAWDSDRRATRSMGAIFVCTGMWALVDLLTYMESDPERAALWMRWAHLPALLMGPSALWVIAEMLPQSRERLLLRAQVGAVICSVVGVGCAFAPGLIEGMIPTEYGGWIPRYGMVSIVLIPIGMILPVYAAVEAARVNARLNQVRMDRRRVWAVRVGVFVSIVVTVPTEYVFPLLEIPVPRLGALSVASLVAILWLRVLYQADDLALTPQGVARAVLAKLHDGVALVQPDGVILWANLRFAEMANLTQNALLETSLADLIDLPIDDVFAGLEEREAMLQLTSGTSTPVSLCSSVAPGRSGQSIGFVVVFRDLREVDALRTKLLTSGRLAAIGELAAGIAHEVNNPVAFIRSDLNLLSQRISELRGCVESVSGCDEEVALFDRGQRRVDAALEGIDRVAQVVGDVREFAHVGGSGQGGSDPESVVAGAMRLARLERGDDVALHVSALSGPERIDSGQELKQILLTFVRMLVDVAEKGGRVDTDIRTRAKSLTIVLTASPLIDRSDVVLARFDALTLDGAKPDFGFAIAEELVDQLGGQLSIDAIDPHTVRVEISIPLLAQASS